MSDEVGLGSPMAHPALSWLRPVEAGDYHFLRWAETTLLGPWWRNQSETTSPPQFEAAIWGGVLAQLLVCPGQREEPVGWCQVFAANLSAGNAELAVAAFGPMDLVLADGVERFVSFVFERWPLQKLNLTLPDTVFDRLDRAVPDLFQIEGRRGDHYYYRDQLHDQVLLSLSRNAWNGSALRAAVLSRRRRVEGLERDDQIDNWVKSKEAR